MTNNLKFILSKLSIEKSHFFLVISLIGYVILLAGKNVDILITPRFWAEEGAVFYRDAFRSGIDCIFNQYGGYYSIVPRLTTYLASLLPMKLAPFITTFTSFSIQIIPAYLILKNSNFSYKYKIMLLVSLLFAGFTNEIFTNTITSQFHFCVIAYLLLIGNYKTSISAPLLLISALTGPTACFILPFFIIKTFFEPNRQNIINSTIFLVGTLIQLAYVIFADLSLQSDRAISDIFSLIFIDKIVNLSFFHLFYGNITTAFKVLIFFIMFYSIYRQDNKKINEIVCFYLLPLILVTFLSTLFSHDSAGGGRYAYASSFIFCCLVIKLITENTDKLFLAYTLAAILFISISISGNYTYKSQEGKHHSSNWVSWESQVDGFKEGKTNEIMIYPQWEREPWYFRP